MENIQTVRNSLRDILGVKAAGRFSDFQIRTLLETFETRPDCVECVLQSLCEESLEGALDEEVVTEEGFVFVDPQQQQQVLVLFYLLYCHGVCVNQCNVRHVVLLLLSIRLVSGKTCK